MKRCLHTEGGFILGDEEAVLEVEKAQFGVWALELTLLVHGLAESISIQAPNGRLVLRLDDRENDRRRAAVSFASDGHVKFDLVRDQAEYLQSFLLRAYRDEMAAVDHVHVEGELEGSPFDLTLMFRAYRPPMSSEEAARLLDE